METSADVAQLDADAAEIAVDAAPDLDATPEVDAANDVSATVSTAEGNEVTPQSLLHLENFCPACSLPGAKCTYKWTVKQPPGSYQQFQPAADFPNPTFAANVAGEYQFCVTSYDANGIPACGPLCETVLVVPNVAVHVELTWDTPNDLDQSDTGPGKGADMDLHFASYKATTGPDKDCDGVGDPWMNNPYDCFWFNQAPEWGSADPAVHDNPTLDLDDADGAGPENLNLEQPEGTLAAPIWYAIGVDYFNDHGFGQSLANVKVYLYGALAVGIDKVQMDPWSWWYVGKLNWPNSMSGNNTPPITVCKQSGDACSKKGKMWQSSGDWCITKCYDTPSVFSGPSPTYPPWCP
jgi:hypothetical protein